MTTDMNVWYLIAQATVVVQLVMLILLVASIVSWVIIFMKRSALARVEKRALEFEERFWSGADLSQLYEKITTEHKVR